MSRPSPLCNDPLHVPLDDKHVLGWQTLRSSARTDRNGQSALGRVRTDLGSGGVQSSRRNPNDTRDSRLEYQQH